MMTKQQHWGGGEGELQCNVSCLVNGKHSGTTADVCNAEKTLCRVSATVLDW